jgi:2-keto-4-pentenoate hydratase/2-oxohepta-3-ene-1,7-dioic acid hydratase in catechol pathway
MATPAHERFSLGTFSGAGNAFFPGLVLPRGEVVPLDRLTPLLHQLDLHLEGVESVLRLLSNWSDNLAALKVIAATVNERETVTPADFGAIALSRLHVHAPIHVPRQIFCTVANYRSHIVDTLRDPSASPRLGEPDSPELLAQAEAIVEERLRGSPYACFKLPSTVIGPTDPMEIPHHAQKTDWELELGVVIGAPCRRATRENAMSFVAGYTLVNDITVRELVARPDLPRLASDWLQSKNSPGFLPTGPFLVPADFIEDPYALRLQLRLNGELMQSELASDMIFDIAAQIAYISQHAQLLPGDIICTGTPAGCGTRHKRFLKPGDVMECTADGLGTLRTQCVAEDVA